MSIAIWVFNPVHASAQSITGVLNTAWESFWHQSGYPRPLYKWKTSIRVRFTGVSNERYKNDSLEHLREVAAHAGISVSEVTATDTAANVEVQFFGRDDPLPAYQPCVTNIAWRDGAIERGTIRANEQAVWRCMLHETMHLMGFTGHPLYHSILTYFARGTELTNVDKLLLKTLYSNDVESGASPFAVLEILARRLVDGSNDGDRNTAREAADAFLRRTVRQMEEFGNGSGEAPAVILRSGKATQQGVDRGQVEVQYFLGVAYARGHIVAADKDESLKWFTKAAAASHAGAIRQLKLAGAVNRN